jgi:hypothetical protein
MHVREGEAAVVRQGHLIAVVAIFLIAVAVVGCGGGTGDIDKSGGERGTATNEETTAPEGDQSAAQTTQGAAGLDQEKAQLDQEIQLKPPPVYQGPVESDSSAFSCETEELGYPLPSGCFNFVLTEATGAMKLASITEDILTTPGLMRCCDYGLVQRVGFFHKDEYSGDPGNPIATIYCFKSKRVAVSALGGALKDAELLGKTENCSLALYRGDAERLKPLH